MSKNNKAFCFCIYGTKPKYTLGILENLKLIQSSFPDFDTIVYYKDDVPTSILSQYQSFKNVFLIPFLIKDFPIMNRFCCFDMFKDVYEYIFVRDADSRISNRDVYCINQFMKSNRSFHTIRDHFYHQRKIMAGMCGINLKKCNSFNILNVLQEWLKTKKDYYGIDEEFLESILYPLIKDDLLIHSNIVGYKDESVQTIDIEQIDDFDFVGNVYEFEESTNKFTPSFTYKKYISKTHIQFLANQHQYKILSKLSKEINIHSVPYEDQTSIIENFYIANYYENNIIQCQKILSYYKFHTITDHHISNSNFLFEKLRSIGKKIIASFNPERIPESDEIIIVYGNYPHTYENLPYSNIVYRHPIYFTQVKHDIVEYEKCFMKIDQIYILNLEERKDRYMELLVELCRIGAPLHRVYHYKAQKDSYTNKRQFDAYIGATKNHYDAVNHFITNNYNYCLVLEDDFQFISNLKKCKVQLTELFEVDKDFKLDFDIVFLAYSKYGKIVRHEEIELISHSEQPCTTSSAYILNKKNAYKIKECLYTGFEKMKLGEDPGIYCCDRYWAKLQPNKKFFVFTDKLGFQKITYSDIVNRINYNFD
jgi:hypothetical protein